jgi:hypothetical protein
MRKLTNVELLQVSGANGNIILPPTGPMFVDIVVLWAGYNGLSFTNSVLATAAFQALSFGTHPYYQALVPNTTLRVLTGTIAGGIGGAVEYMIASYAASVVQNKASA